MTVTIDEQIKWIVEKNLPNFLVIGAIYYPKDIIEFVFIDETKDKKSVELISAMGFIGSKVREKFDVLFDINEEYYKHHCYLTFYADNQRGNYI